MAAKDNEPMEQREQTGTRSRSAESRQRKTEGQYQATEATAAKPIDELKAKGTLTLTSKTREELFTKYGELQADADGMKLSCGCVGQTVDSNYVMNVSIIKE